MVKNIYGAINFNSKKMTEIFIRSWLKKKPLVVAGYAGKTKGVNLYALIGFWLDCCQDWGQLEDDFPDVAEDFQIVVPLDDDPRMLRDILPEFDGCRYVKCWCYGDELDLQGLKNE